MNTRLALALPLPFFRRSRKLSLVNLAPGELRRLDGAAGLRLELLQGRLWLTQPGDPDDHFLRAGQGLRLQAGRGVLLQSEGEEAVRYLLRAA